MSLETELLEVIDKVKKSRFFTGHFEAGLTDQEVSDIEERCEFNFPPDLKLFLQIGLPLGDFGPYNSIDNFPNWRNDPVKIMQDNRQLLEDGFYFDIENNNFWMPKTWGEKPETLAEQLAIAKDYLQTVPELIPICAHRMIPVEPCEVGNPVFSILQPHDTIYYGYNLQSYLWNEFISPGKWDEGQASDYRDIRFWSKLVPRPSDW
ncbi:MAG: hypothetical protein H0X30_01005 [Anaerolineae bacterium]|nr:hypothetical protein [Anaerolineae bacterium]